MSYPQTSNVAPGYVYYDQASQYGQPQGFGGGFPDTSGVAQPTPAQAPVQQAQPFAQPVHSEIVIPPLQTTAFPPQQQQIQIPVKGPEVQLLQQPQQMVEVSKGVRLGGPSPPDTLPVVRVEEHVDPCCSLVMSAVCFALVGLVAFIIVVTVTSQLVFGNNRAFCNNYVSALTPRLSPPDSFPQSNHNPIALSPQWTTANDPTQQFQLSGMVRLCPPPPAHPAAGRPNTQTHTHSHQIAHAAFIPDTRNECPAT
jgi:hypothetical protein